jgi:hypothetical protein
MDENAAKKAMEIFTPQEMAEISQMDKKRLEPGFAEKYHDTLRKWEVFIDKVRQNQKQDPASEIGRILALEWIVIFEGYYGEFPTVRHIMKEKADVIEASGALDSMWGPGAWPWIKQAFIQHNIALPE